MKYIRLFVRQQPEEILKIIWFYEILIGTDSGMIFAIEMHHLQGLYEQGVQRRIVSVVSFFRNFDINLFALLLL